MHKLTPCHEPRGDFTEADGSLWPLYIHKGGSLFGFCPSKVARDDHETSEVYRLLVVVAETGQLLVGGGLLDQPAWFIEELAWFLPRYSSYKFARQAAMCLGGGEEAPKKQLATNEGTSPAIPARGRGRKMRGG